MSRHSTGLEYDPRRMRRDGVPELPRTAQLAKKVGFDVALAAAAPTARRPELLKLPYLGTFVTTVLVMGA